MNKEYRSTLLKLAIPIMVQNLLSSALSSMDVVMLNFVSQDAISAVSLAAQITSILFMVFYGMGTGATMLAAQYYGKGEMKAVKVVMGIALRIAIICSLVLAIAVLAIPEYLMLIFTNDTSLVNIGAEYLRYMSIAYISWGVIEVYLSVLRSIGRVQISMFLNLMAFFLNIIFNTIFIFGFLGAPKMGAAGAALGTSLARLIELIGCLIVSAASKDVKLEPKYLFVRNKVLFKDFCNSALPAVGNDMVWGLAFSMYSVILGHLGTDAVAANSLVTVVRNFGTIMCFGLASAGCILIGQVIGENRLEDAKIAAKELVRLTIISGIIGAIIILAATPLVLKFADLSDTALNYLKWMLLINVYYVFGPAINTSLICGIFRGGGDSKFGFKVDIIDMWVYAVPLGFLAAFVFKLPVMWVYFLMCTDEFVKWPWVIGHYLKGTWAKNITRNDWNQN